MRTESLREKKAAKGFYIRGFRYSVIALLGSVILNVALLGGIHNRLLHPEKTNFYATNGFFPAPIKLHPLDAPNESSVALLPNDQPAEMGVRALPENI